MSNDAAPPDQAELGAGAALRALAVVGPPITIGTALLFYFGWALTAEQSIAMGVDESIFSMTTRDFVLRSLSALFVPLIAVSAALLAWLFVHVWLLELIAGRRHLEAIRVCSRILAWSAWWFLPLTGALVGLAVPRWAELVLPLTIAVGLLLSEYGARLVVLVDTAMGRPRAPRARWVSNLRGVLFGVLVTAALFWEVANFAGVVGRGKAETVAASVAELPEVVVYSQRDLHIEASDVEAAVFRGAEDDYRFRYTGLRLLQRTGGKFFLVPTTWLPDTAPILVLPDEGWLRLEFKGSSS